MSSRGKVGRRSLVPVDVGMCWSYIDTICLQMPVGLDKARLRQLRLDLLRALRPFNGRYYMVRITRPDGFWFWTLYVHQPSIEALQALQVSRVPWRISQVHLALDICTTDRADSDKLHRHVEQLLVPTKRPSVATQHVLDQTTYFGKGNRRGLEVVLYSDRKSKVDKQSACLHIDWRVMGSVALRKAHLREPADLLRLNHRSFWDKRLCLLRAPPEDELLRYRRRELQLRNPNLLGSVLAEVRLVRSTLRAAQGPHNCRPLSSDLLHLANKHKWIYGPRSLRMFATQPHTWMLPGEFNALWLRDASDL